MISQQLCDALCDPLIDPLRLDILGVRLGASAKAVPQARVVEVAFSPLVKSLVFQAGEPIGYLGFDKQPVSADRAYASVVYDSGVLHTDEDVSFVILDSRVARMSFYGRCLAELAHVDTLSKLHQRFGYPNRCFRIDADGDGMGYDSYYASSDKWVRWLAAAARPTVVTFGAGEAAVVEGLSGGVCSTLVAVRSFATGRPPSGC